MKTGTELMLENQPSMRDEMRDILQRVWDGVLTPDQAMSQIETIVTTVVRTALDAGAMRSLPPVVSQS